MYQVNLGVLPAILVSAVLKLGDYVLKDKAINHMIGEQFEAIKRLNEEQLRELSVMLSLRSDRPEWEWFNILRTARVIGYWDTTGNVISPPPPPPEPHPGPGMNTYLLIGGAVLLIIIAMR